MVRGGRRGEERDLSGEIERILLASPAPGTERHLLAARFGGPDARPKAYIQAGLHADEWPGLLVAQHLLARLHLLQGQGRVHGQVVVVPFANPIGLSQYLNGHLSGRFDFGGSGNFNRDFPCLATRALPLLRDLLDDDPVANATRVRAALVQAARTMSPRREADWLKARLLSLSADADWALDLHCDGQSLLHLYASARQQETAVALARDLGAALVLLETDPGGSPFDEANAAPWWRLAEALPEYPLPLGCFAATVELRGRSDVDDALAAQDAEGILRFLGRQGVVSGLAYGDGPAPLVARLQAVDIAEAPATGLMVYRRGPGERVAEGDILGEIVNPAATSPAAGRTPVHSRTSGLLFARPVERFVRQGDHLCKVAGSSDLSHRQPGALLED